MKNETLQTAAVCIILYGAMLFIGAVVFSVQADDFSKMPRVLLRIFGVFLISYGLWKNDKYGWWFGLFICILAIIQHFTVIFTGRVIGPTVLVMPINPTIDAFFSGLSIFVLGYGLRLLLMKSSRESIR